MNIVQENIFELNKAWKQKNITLLALHIAQLKQQKWEALITLAQWGKSERHRMALWESAKKEFHITEADPLQEEEAALFTEIDCLHNLTASSH